MVIVNSLQTLIIYGMLLKKLSEYYVSMFNELFLAKKQKYLKNQKNPRTIKTEKHGYKAFFKL